MFIHLPSIKTMEYCTSLSPPATVVVSLANLEGEESFDSSLLGSAEQVVQERICDDELILIRGYVCACVCVCGGGGGGVFFY